MKPNISRRAVPLAAAVMLVFGIGAYAGAAAPGTVTIANFAFSPTPLTVAPGTKVTWTNTDEEPHTVVSADGGKSFKSAALDTNDKFSFTFDKPGTYKYFCSIHSYMAGTIVVK
ncbi:MAG TPA: cupredoxin family copper-binding protein [Stellaceae bacterium]|nr:cupredoxin family copper-binding protein [Stellaceae bacterium]